MGLSAKVIIEIDGEEVKDFVDLEIIQDIHHHNQFNITCRLDTFEQADTFVMEKTKNFIGKPIKINIEDYESGFQSSKPAFFFKGIVTQIKAVKTDISQMDTIVISGYSPDILLDDNPGNKSYSEKTLKQIAEDILRTYPRDLLRYNINPNHNDLLLYTVQYNESRFDFLGRLARRYGEWFYYDGMELCIGNPPENVTKLTLGLDLLEFSFELQLGPLNANFVSYNPSNDSVVASATSSSSGTNQLNEVALVAHRSSMKLYNQQATVLYNHLNSLESNYASESKNVVETFSAGKAVNMSHIHGSSQNPNLKLGSRISVKAIKENGTVDYGEYIITGITHTCDNMMTYKNYFNGILAKSKVPEYTNPVYIPTAEIQNAKVTDNNDPDKLGRVKVRFHWQTDEETPWIRIAYPNAGQGSGFYFIPEIGEEVMVGFEGGDAEKPFVIGSMYNSNNKPAGNWSSGTNDIKILRTRGGNTIELVDGANGTEISIYQENDKSASHHITMTTGSTPEMKIFSKDKLVIEAKSIEIKSNQGDIEINAMSKLNIESKSDMSLKGMNLKAESNMNTELKGGMNVKVEGVLEAEVKGSMSAKLDGGASTTIKGLTVMIN